MIIIMTSAIGKFTFAEDTPLSHAKIVRDGVTSQVLAPKQKQQELKSIGDIYNYVRSWETELISKVDFDLELNEVGEKALLKNMLQPMTHWRVNGKQQMRLFEQKMREIADRFAMNVDQVKAFLVALRSVDEQISLTHA